MNTDLTVPTLDHMEFLSWVARAYFFSGDLRKQLTALGASEADALDFAFSNAVRQGNIVDLFETCGRAQPEVFQLFLADCWTKWIDIQAERSNRAGDSPSVSP